jgi:probable rRNA maturation factor
VDPDSKRLRIAVTDGRGSVVRATGLARWLARVAPARARGEVAIALVTDAHIRALNRQYRRKDTSTDVLSFPAVGKHVSRMPDPASRIPPARPPLGDIVIATGVARRQARDAGHSYETELRVLALHGLLHLLGYDHESTGDRGRMARLEARLRREGGLREGLIERGRLPPARARLRT